MNSIKEANLLEVNNTMPLIVIYNEKNVVRKVLSLTKDISFDMWSFIKDNFHDKVFLNKIYNYLNNLIDEESMKRLKGAKNIEDFMKLLNTFSYVTLRKLYFYLYEK